MAIGSIACTGTTIAMCRFEVGRFTGSLQGAMTQLRQSTAFFIYKSSGQLMTTAATTVLGAIAGKAAVGIFAPTEKVVKAVIGLALPVFHAFYPHLSRLFVQDRQKTHRQSIMLVLFVSVSGLFAAIALSFAGPAIMHWMLGPGFDAVNQLLLLMVWLIPLRLLNQTLGFAVLLPANMEHRAGGATLLSSAISLGLGAYLAASQGVLQGAVGMVTGMLVGEALLLLAQLYLSKRVFSSVSQ
jgi:PST family polysaccharide transporter